VHVRKVLHFAGPLTERGAREIAELIASGRIAMHTVAKWAPDDGGYGRHPVETIIGDDPQIVAVRRVQR
jgi:hypothetical protein